MTINILITRCVPQSAFLAAARARPHITKLTDAQLAKVRADLDAEAAKVPFDDDIKTELAFVKREGFWKGLEGPATPGSIECEWIEENDTSDHLQTKKQKPVVLFIHGGGFCVMSTTTHRGLMTAVARLGTKVFGINYRLAPEHPFPAGLADIITAYRYLLDDLNIPASEIVFMGDSSGGNMVLAAALYCRESGMEMPAGIVAISPWTDLTGSAPSNLLNELDTGPVIPSGPIEGPKRLNAYAPNSLLHRPLVSPIFSFPTGTPLPPTYICTGELERAFDEHVGTAVRWSDRDGGRAGGVWGDVFEGQVHAWQMRFPAHPMTTLSLQRIALFIDAAVSHALTPAKHRPPFADKFCIVGTDGAVKEVGREGFQEFMRRNYEKAMGEEEQKMALNVGWMPSEIE
ncbi:hypothetical protein HDU93_009799 [Gonapodya sp. JEL0774]|nr:hypothetical protein HDU93_009799 [Gonapodya sp. JEL0774]